ncbi:MAG TPA: S-methyl-5-thioribose-1-phosphate isomerase [Elusimicrobiota bacterium]|nr:S-methyl-5-thioribose-1-phosphate isomerase [Elusimicrobiota bacterium]
MRDPIRHIVWRGGSLRVLDQRLLPRRTVYRDLRTCGAVADAIRDMTVRGAPLIGCAAAYGFALAFRNSVRRPQAEIEKASARLLASRPTAVNLAHAVARMRARAERALAGGEPLFSVLAAEADAFLREDIAANRRMADNGAALIPRGSTVMTYCNAGALATGGIGTAVGVIRRAHQLGKVRAAYACETRPYLQGSRLTLWELMQAKIPSTLITDNMAAHLMATQRIDAVVVGADRIAANGDAANKIGTYGLAILARHHGIPFYVAAPTTTIDLSLKDGRKIPIEERSADEVLLIGRKPIAPKGARARHPAFDVTPRKLISAIVTERGVIRPARGESVRKLFKKG